MLTHVKNFKAIWKDEGAVTALEYAILAGLVAAALVGMFATWGSKLATKLTSALGLDPVLEVMMRAGVCGLGEQRAGP